MPLLGQGNVHLVTSSASDASGEQGDLTVNISSSCRDSTLEFDRFPEDFALHQNFPNPFNSTTSIGYTLKEDSPVRLTIYNLLGQKVVVLVDGLQKAGVNSVIWDGKDPKGNPLPSGIYFYRLELEQESQTRKMVLTK